MPLNNPILDAPQLVAFAAVDAEGVITRTGMTMDPQAGAGDGEIIVTDDLPDDLDDTRHYWTGTDWAEYPAPRPSCWHVWQGGAWVDQTPPADAGPTLAERRAVASLTRSDLIAAVIRHELLPPEEIRQAIAGQVPASLAAMMDTMPLAAQLEAENKWANDDRISRTHPVIQAAAYAMGLDDDFLDQVFGVTQ